MQLSDFAQLVLELLHHSSSLVIGRGRQDPETFFHHQAELSKKLKALESVKDSLPWEWWPQSPTTFGQYQRAGFSALEVAFQFAQTVDAAVQCAKVIHLQTFKVDSQDQQKVAEWMQGTANELESMTLELSRWSAAELLRDVDLLSKKIQFEYDQASRIAAKAQEAIIHQIDPSGRDGETLVAMSELGAVSPDTRRTQDDITLKANGGFGKDSRKVFTKLLELKMIEKGINGRGYFLTQFGQQVAENIIQTRALKPAL